jgi:hypothetical protein
MMGDPGRAGEYWANSAVQQEFREVLGRRGGVPRPTASGPAHSQDTSTKTHRRRAAAGPGNGPSIQSETVAAPSMPIVPAIFRRHTFWPRSDATSFVTASRSLSRLGAVIAGFKISGC